MDIDNNMLESIYAAGGSASRLTIPQKQWLGSQVVDGRDSILNLVKRVGLPRRVIKRYVHKVRHQCIFKSKPGRSRLLDEESLDSVQHWASENQCLTDDENADDLVEKINFEKVKSTVRLRNSDLLIDVGQIRRVSPRSLGRYIKIVLQTDNSEVIFRSYCIY